MNDTAVPPISYTFPNSRDSLPTENSKAKSRLATEGLSSSLEHAKIKTNDLLDQIALTEDLRIHFQNKCLSEITGNKIPQRKPKDVNLPVLIADAKGNLLISEAKKNKQDKNNDN